MKHRPFRPFIMFLAIFIFTLSAATAFAALEWEKRAAIEAGLVWLANNQTISGDEGYWSYGSDGTLACTGAAALAFIEQGFLPGQNVIIDEVDYGDVVGFAVNYIFNRTMIDSRFGVETAVYERYAEDYNNDGIYDEGNDEAIFFNPGAYNRNVYTTGICTPVVYALGEELGLETVIDRGSAAINGKTYAEAMQDIVDWFSFAQVEPSQGNNRGGWRYDANWPDSDNSTAQWGSLPLLYGRAWGLGTPNYVFSELELWVNYVQNANGGSGYSGPNDYINVSKTGGLLLELRAIGAPVSDSRVQAALGFINGRWNNWASGDWYGNLNHPYAMWAVYKGLEVYGFTEYIELLDRLVLIGNGMPAAPGGFDVGFVEESVLSEAGDWYSHYCDLLVDLQNANGSWNGYTRWVGALASGWYINILNAAPVPPPGNPTIRLETAISGDCVVVGDEVAHTADYWLGTPGVPGDRIALDVQVVMTLSQHMIFVDASEGGLYDADEHTVTWMIGTLDEGDEGEVTVNAVIAGSAPPGAVLITHVLASASNIDEGEWGTDFTEVDVCPSTCVWNQATDVVERGVSHGVAWGDYDNDQDPDLLVTSGGKNQLYENVDGVLVMVEGWNDDEEPSYGAAWADYDNDGDLDVYVVNSNVANALYNNDGGVFTRVAAGDAEDAGDGYNAAWADIDGDNDLDLYICNRNGTNRLLENDGGMFTSLGGVTEYTGTTRGCAFADYDNDGDQDLYLSVYGNNMLFRNDDGVFVDVSASPMDDGGEGKGVAWADFDNDQDLDLYLVNTQGANKLFRNDLETGGYFTDVTDDLLGDENNGRTCAWADYNNDGWMDLFFTNIDSGRNILFENVEGVFADANCGVLEDTAILESWGCAFADYDGDGDQDLAMAIRTLDGPSKVFRNDTLFGTPFNWLQIDLRGATNNRFGVGARVVVDTGELTLTRAINANGGYLGQSPLTASFGVGEATRVDVTVYWPNGEIQTLTNLPVNRRLEIVDAAGAVGVDDLPTSSMLTVTNYPNPFNPSTTLEFSLPRSAEVEMKVLDARGRLVRTLLVGEALEAGVHRVRWQGRSDSGREVPSGVYFFRCAAGGDVVTGRMVLLK